MWYKIHRFWYFIVLQWTQPVCSSKIYPIATKVGPQYRISWSIRRTVIFSLEIWEKNNDECILILVIYWKKTGLLHTKISNHNIIYPSLKPRKSLSMPLKSSSWLFSLNAFKFGNNTYPRRIRRRSNLGHIVWWGDSASYGTGNMVFLSQFRLHSNCGGTKYKETNFIVRYYT